MELFSIGIGHYTEQDVKEAARAFTGWTVNKKVSMNLTRKNMMTEKKTVFGKNW